MYGVAGRLKAYFYRTDDAFVAVSAASEGGRLEKYVCRDSSWQLEEKTVLSSAGALYDQTVNATGLQELAEQAAIEINRKDWQDIPLLYIVPETEQVRYALNLPPGLNAVQQQEAAYWELDDKLLAQGLSAENFACVCHASAESGNSCTITGVSKGYLQEAEETFAQAELTLADIVPAGGIMDYLRSQQREIEGFKKRQGAGLAVKRILAVWFAAWLTVGLILLSADFLHYRQAYALAEQQEHELALLSAEVQEMHALTAQTGRIADREKKIQAFSSQGMPWYSLLVHLGTNTAQGVLLTGINVSADGHKLYLEGQAVSYDCLAEFIGQFEADKLFFAQGVTLENSEVLKGRGNEPDKVQFSLSIDWEPNHEGKHVDEVQDSQSK